MSEENTNTQSGEGQESKTPKTKLPSLSHNPLPSEKEVKGFGLKTISRPGIPRTKKREG